MKKVFILDYGKSGESYRQFMATYLARHIDPANFDVELSEDESRFVNACRFQDISVAFVERDLHGEEETGCRAVKLARANNKVVPVYLYGFRKEKIQESAVECGANSGFCKSDLFHICALLEDDVICSRIA